MSSPGVRKGDEFDCVALADNGGFVSPGLDRHFIDKLNRFPETRDALARAEAITGRQTALMKAWKKQGVRDDDIETRMRHAKAAEIRMTEKIELEKARLAGRYGVAA